MIYLDQAATSLPKPREVVQAVAQALNPRAAADGAGMS